MRRPVLVPGLQVLRHSRDELQVGSRPDRRVRLPDTEPVRRTLGHLLRGEAVPDAPETRAVLAMLEPVLVEGEALIVPGVAATDVAAAAGRDPAGFMTRIERRLAARVQVLGELGADPRPLLEAAGVPVAEDAGTVVLALCPGEIDRAALDPLVRHRTPHLVVRLVEGTLVVGPLVVPGATACLRCVDLHHADAWSTTGHRPVPEPVAHAPRHDGVATPVDTALTTLGVAWAVRDLVSHVEGDRGTTWSTTVELAPGLASVTEVHWRRHPACGCAWALDGDSSATMEQ